MSSVTIKELYWELNNEELREANKLWDDAKDIEVVPRKMVEMIIEKAKEECADVNNSYYSRKINNIWEYAESLLKQFEEDGEDDRN